MEIASKLTSNVLKFISYPESTFTYNNRFSHGRTTLHCSSATRKLEIRSPPNRPLRKRIQPITPHRPKPIITTTSEVLRLMDSLGLGIPLDIYVSLIKECTQDRDPARAVELHAHFNRSGIRPCLGLLNRLLIMFVSCGCIEYARQLFDEMPVRDCNSWAAIIAGYADNGDYGEAIEIFVLFLRRRHYDFISVVAFPVSWILVCVLDACVHTFDLEVGKQIHGWLLKSGYLSDLFLSSSLINFYGKVGWSEGADLVFDQITHRNVVVWTARIVNKCKEERFDEVLSVFKEMGKEGVKKNSFTFSSVLRACAKMSDVTHCGEQVHANAIKLGLVSKCYVQSGLVNMYGKFGLIRDAKKAFEMNGRRRNNACWNAMLTAYIHNGFYIEAVKFLYQMKAAGVEPQELLLNEVRYACGCQIFETGLTAEMYIENSASVSYASIPAISIKNTSLQPMLK